MKYVSMVAAQAAVLGALAAAAGAQEQLEEVIVIGDTVGELKLDEVAISGSRLGLTPLETPASIEIIDSTVLRGRGYQKLSEAVQSLPGVLSGEAPGAPATFTMRGFTSSQISILRDGVWLGPSNLVVRPQNTFNLDRVEVLRGPSSVLNGIGAVGSTVNTVSKTAAPVDTHSFEALGSFGRFESYHVGAGTAGPVGDSIWYRTDISRYAAEGYVERMDPESTNLTASLLWQATQALSLKLSVDYLEDDLAKYFGTPLVPLSAARNPMTDIIATRSGETIDEAMRFKNYNVSDGRAEAQELLVRTDAEWRLGDWILTNALYRYDADREWVNAEGYAYCTQVVDVCTRIGDLQRYYGYFFVFHDQELWGDRFTAKLDHTIGGLENRFLVGAEATDIDFSRSRGFRRSIPPAPGDSVDPYNPVPGRYGPLELRGISPTKIETRAVFIEDALDVGAWTFVTALRYDEMDLDRQNLSASGVPEPSGFTRDYQWWSWRAGAVYRITNDFVAYGQFSDASDPVNANVFLVSANENFDLTDARQWEVGLKANLAGGRAQMTFAYFDIARDDVFERFSLDSTRNIGGIDSRGVELAATFAASDRWKLGANAGYTDAQFIRSANVQAFAGNTPPNVPEWTANAWTSVSQLFGSPFEVGASARYVDNRYGENSNNVLFKQYALLDAYVAWSRDNYRVSLKVENITDEPFIASSDVYYLGQTNPSYIYANQVILGSPRSYEISAHLSF